MRKGKMLFRIVKNIELLPLRIMDRKESYLSVIGAHYVPDIVLDFLPRIFEAYKIRDYKSKNFQVSACENTLSTAGLLLSVASIESYANRIFRFEEKRGPVPEKISEIFWSKNNNFPKEDFERLLCEVYILRDVIVHNHIYDISTAVDRESWEIKHLDETLVIGKGEKDKKFKECVDCAAKKTKLLKLHVQPLKIGFEDLFTVLFVFDTFVRLSQSMLSDSHVPFRLYCKIGKTTESSLSRLLASYYRQITNEEYLKALESLLTELRGKYAHFLVSPYDDAFINNICPRPNCGKIGFHTILRGNTCAACGLSIGRPLAQNA